MCSVYSQSERSWLQPPKWPHKCLPTFNPIRQSKRRTSKIIQTKARIFLFDSIKCFYSSLLSCKHAVFIHFSCLKLWWVGMLYYFWCVKSISDCCRFSVRYRRSIWPHFDSFPLPLVNCSVLSAVQLLFSVSSKQIFIIFRVSDLLVSSSKPS